MLKYGLRVDEGKIYCEDIEIPALRIARTLEIDRRVVNATANTITNNEELNRFFENLHPIPFFRDIALEMGWGVVEIVPKNAAQTGILASVSKVIADAGISIRQAISEDPELSEAATLTIICEKEIPAELIPRIKKISGVKKVIIH